MKKVLLIVASLMLGVAAISVSAAPPNHCAGSVLPACDASQVVVCNNATKSYVCQSAGKQCAGSVLPACGAYQVVACDKATKSYVCIP